MTAGENTGEESEAFGKANRTCDSSDAGALCQRMSLERFQEAQDNGGTFERALQELRSGEKRSHWIWFVFPQIAGLGRSSTAQHYALRDLGEARDYLRDDVLRARWIEATEAVADQLTRGAELRELMGGEVDALKLVSNMTLFECAAREEPARDEVMCGVAALCAQVLAMAERQGYRRCAHTLKECRQT